MRPFPLKLLSDKHSPIESAYAIVGHMTPTHTAKAAPNCRVDDHIYGWTRFWVPETGTINLSDGGFLLDPTDLVRRSHVSGPAPLADLSSYRALALLGEPGIGKSAALKAEVERIAAKTNAVSIYVDLRGFSSDVLLYRKVFESAKFTAWKNGTSHLFLHLDSLDEALLRVETIANLLASELPHYPTARMSVRIACRTAVWPASTLGHALETIWGKEASGVFELAPLRRQDVAEAAKTHQIEPDAFVRELYAANAVPFAIKPLTLKMLLRLYHQRGCLPSSSEELYTQGCLKLCEEQNKSRRDTGRLGRLNPAQRLRLAGRVAVATMLGNRFAIWTGPEVGAVPPEDVPMSALAGGHEQGNFSAFDFTDDDLREVLNTGLFSSRGGVRMGWAHQSYAEFLAALYLVEKNLSSGTILRVLLHPAGGCQRRRKNASIFRNKNTSVKLARRAGNLGPFPRGSGLRPFIRRGVGTGAA